jgi:hypothetical protein
MLLVGTMHVTSTVQLVYNQSEIEQKPHFGGVFCFQGVFILDFA